MEFSALIIIFTVDNYTHSLSGTGIKFHRKYKYEWPRVSYQLTICVAQSKGIISVLITGLKGPCRQEQKGEWGGGGGSVADPCHSDSDPDPGSQRTFR